ncbi:MAG: hypothetical protein Q8Q08_03185 [Candidatus Omnitrophota bacterium]|nr:hypothetical protein [Candidatus Omnitrophota bacterium]MDZ4241465.1 hypothetical protein [Candidatus Omnitrophota bacterium]
MTDLLIIFPVFLSFLTGYGLIGVFFRSENLSVGLRAVLGLGLGLGVSGHLVFYTLVFGGKFSAAVVIAAHILLLSALAKKHLSGTKARGQPMVPLFRVDTSQALAGLMLLLLLITACVYASHFPWGGWDAWSIWNFKARFIFLGGDRWQNMLDPVLWRSSPHYPLLLPLINAWAWSCLPAPSATGPLAVSLIFLGLTAGLLSAGLLRLTGDSRTALAPGLIISLPFFVKLTIGQYSDITLGFYLLAGVIVFLASEKTRDDRLLFLAGVFWGFLSFTKPEGTVAAFLLVLCGLASLMSSGAGKGRRARALLAGAGLAFLPTVLFQFFYSPGNQTYVNGLLDGHGGLATGRLRWAAAFLWVELTSGKWNGLWIILLAGLVLSGGRCLRKDVLFIPVFLVLYLTVVLAYYQVNAYFEIKWWLQVTLHRVLYSLLPLIIFWVFYSLWGERIEDRG